MTVLVTWLSLLLICAPLSADERVVVTLEPTTDASVGAASLAIKGWHTPDPAALGDRALGPRSLEADFTVGGLPVRMVFEWTGASDTPSHVWWSVRGEALQPVALTSWEKIPTQDGHVYLLRAELSEGLLPRLTVMVHHASGLEASWDIDAVSRGHFELDGEPHRLLLFDCDFDGRFAGDQDRWIAGPVNLLSSLRFSNPKTQMRWLDEPSDLAGRELRFVGHAGAEASLAIGGPCSVSDGLREHFARIQTAFLKAYRSTRREALVSAGEDPERPTTDTPTEWLYVTDLSSARAHAERVGRPLLLELTSHSCGYCRLQTLVTHRDADVASVQGEFACVRLVSDLDLERSYEAVGFDGGVPHTLAFDAQGEKVADMRGFTRPTDYVQGLRAALDSMAGG